MTQCSVSPAWEARPRAGARQVPALDPARAEGDEPKEGCVILTDQREVKDLRLRPPPQPTTPAQPVPLS